MPSNYWVTVSIDGYEKEVRACCSLRDCADNIEQICAGTLNPRIRTQRGTAELRAYVMNCMRGGNRADMTIVSLGHLSGERVVGTIAIERSSSVCAGGVSHNEFKAEAHIGGYVGDFFAVSRDRLFSKIVKAFPDLEERKCYLFYDGTDDKCYNFFRSKMANLFKNHSANAKEIVVKFMDGDTIRFTRRAI